MRILVVPDSLAAEILREHPGVRAWEPAGSREHLVAAFLPTEVVSSAAAEQARRNAELRKAFLDEFAALDAEDVAIAAGSRATNQRALASRWRSEGAVLAVDVGGRALYPAFQFDDGGRPRPAVGRVIAALAPLALTAWESALWWATPHDMLDWARPADELAAHPDAVVEAAGMDAATLGA